ncbi:MAG: hypothetical protein KF726_17235 [Anaerolineae bacterium]|nr:hypothetical protein [Anaerolineae bacterium]
MTTRPEPGRFGYAVLMSYTYFLSIGVFGIIQWFTDLDLKQASSSYLRTAFSIDQNSTVSVIMFFGCYILSVLPIGSAVQLYYKYTGRTYTGDRIGFAKSGGHDIATWAGLLSFVLVVYVFARFIPAGILGVGRVVVIFVASFFLSGWLTRTLTGLLYEAMYRPRLTTTFGLSSLLRCQILYPTNYARCPNPTYRILPICRWHRIMAEFRRDYQIAPWAAHVMMYLAGSSFFAVIFCSYQFSVTVDGRWLLPIVASTGMTFATFADSVMARNYPLSQYALWAKMLSTGILLVAIGAAILAFYAVLAPDATRAFVQQLTTDERLIDWSPALIGIIGGFGFGIYGRMFLRRVLFIRNRFANWGVYGVQLGLIGAALQPLFMNLSPISPQNSPDFWTPILGDSNLLPIGIVWFIAFNICEIINVRARRAELTDAEFKRTFEISYGACILPAVLGLFAARYLMIWLTLSGVVILGAISIAIAIPLCMATTRWVINWGRTPPLAR